MAASAARRPFPPSPLALTGTEAPSANRSVNAAGDARAAEFQ